MFKGFVITAAFILSLFAGNALAEKVDVNLEGHCGLTYKAKMLGEGPCQLIQTDTTTAAVKGTVAENGQKYTAIINNDKNEGLLIGAGTFTLADGKLTTNDKFKVEWPNGYALTLKLK